MVEKKSKKKTKAKVKLPTKSQMRRYRARSAPDKLLGTWMDIIYGDVNYVLVRTVKGDKPRVTTNVDLVHALGLARAADNFLRFNVIKDMASFFVEKEKPRLPTKNVKTISSNYIWSSVDDDKFKSVAVVPAKPKKKTNKKRQRHVR